MLLETSNQVGFVARLSEGAFREKLLELGHLERGIVGGHYGDGVGGTVYLLARSRLWRIPGLVRFGREVVVVVLGRREEATAVRAAGLRCFGRLCRVPVV